MLNREDPQPAPTADQIRRAIDSGCSGEKVDALDPAAAPLLAAAAPVVMALLTGR